MSTYFSFFRMRFLTLIQYRTAALAGVCTQWVFGMMKVLVLYAFYQSSDASQPMLFYQAATYVWIGQAMLGIQPWSVDAEIANSVLTGQVAYELTRPLDIYAMWFARTFALRTAPTLLRAVPQFIIAIFIVPAPYHMTLPTPCGLAAWLATILLAALLSTAFTSLMHTLILRTVRAEGVVRFMPVLVMLLSGMVVPLRLMPDWVQPFMRLQPFAGLMDLPSQLFSGSLAPANVVWVVSLQLFWTGAFVLAGRLLMKNGLSRLSVAGG
jgi:ABC-2 type transport system permease protein